MRCRTYDPGINTAFAICDDDLAALTTFIIHDCQMVAGFDRDKNSTLSFDNITLRTRR